jgi:ribosomal protein S10
MTLVSRAKLNSINTNTIYVKQSYVLLTWMTYIRETHSSNVSQNVSTNELEEDSLSTPSFFVHPPKKARLTFLKAPMAHKTFSQEQFINQSYNLTISFNSTFRKQANINTVNNSLYIALHLRNMLLPVETNLLFLKKQRTSITSNDKRFMTL